MRRAALLALAGIVWATAAEAQETRYVNERFGTSVSFPGTVFIRSGIPPTNGDGMTWYSADGASLAVFGGYNVLSHSPRDIVADAAGPGIRITYSRTGSDWAVVSGFDGADVFYSRTEFGADDVMHTVRITYPAARKDRYDPLVGPIASSLDGP